jgi:hypothetical protein
MPVELEASASIGIAIGSKLDDIHSLLSKPEPKPTFLPVPASITGPGALRIGRPPAGKMWNILTVTTTGADDHTAVANAFVSIYVDSDPLNLGLGQCLIPGIAVPFFDSASKGTLWAHSSGDVVANVAGSGVAATTQINVTLTVAEWSVKDVARMDTR